MTALSALVKRNCKLYFRDRGMFFSSLITPIILLVLYVTFLKSVYDDSFRSALAAAGATLPDALREGFVGGHLVSSLLAVSCVTVAFCSNLLVIKDRTSGARRDLTMAPISPALLGLGYYLATLASTLLVNLTAAAACLGYLAIVGWYLSAADVALLLLDVVLLTLFGTTLAACITAPLTTDGQASAVGTIVSAGYGFVCGAYMPISGFGTGLQHVLSLLPGTYATSLLRNHAMAGVFAELKRLGCPEAALTAIRQGFDCSPSFFGTPVSVGAMYAIVAGSTAVLLAVYLLLSDLPLHRR